MDSERWDVGKGPVHHYPKRSDWVRRRWQATVPALSSGGGFDVIVARPFSSVYLMLNTATPG